MRNKRVFLLLSTCLVILVSAYFIAPALLIAEEHTSVDESSDEYTSVDESSDEYTTEDETTDEYTTVDETTDEETTEDVAIADEATGEEVPETGQTGNSVSRVVISSTLLTLAASLFYIQRRKRKLD